MPAGAIYVGRPTRWGNPYFTESMPREQKVALYRDYVTARIAAGELDIEELRGKDLACWCALDVPCHADVLLELAR